MSIQKSTPRNALKKSDPWKHFKGPLPPEDFKELLLQVMDKKDHWAWGHFSGNRITKKQLKIHFQQEYEVYVRDFPIFLSRIHCKNPPMEVRQDLVSNLYEEETGRLSLGRPHPELFLVMMKGLVYPLSEFSNIRMLPGSRRYRKWLDQVTTGPSWLLAAIVVTIFVEGSIQDRKECEPSRRPDPVDVEEKIKKHPLVEFHGLNPACLDLVRAHHHIEGSHRLAAWRMVLDHAKDARIQKEIYQSLSKSLQLWLSYRDDVALACQLNP